MIIYDCIRIPVRMPFHIKNWKIEGLQFIEMSGATHRK